MIATPGSLNRGMVSTAGKSMIVESLAAQLQVSDHPVRWIAMLNGLEPGAELHQGQKAQDRRRVSCRRRGHLRAQIQ